MGKAEICLLETCIFDNETRPYFSELLVKFLPAIITLKYFLCHCLSKVTKTIFYGKMKN